MWIGLGAAASGAAVLSATLGMAGGMLLMGLFTALLPVQAALALHGATQLVANGSRAWVLRDAIRWPQIACYAGGGVLGAIAVCAADFQPSRAVVYLGVGAMPFAARALPSLDFADRRAAGLCGVLVTAVQLGCGVAGPVLDAFFTTGTLDKRAIVSTKATSQVIAHSAKVLYYLPAALALPPAALVACGVGAAFGTWAGTRLLGRLSEDTFRTLTRWLVLALGAGYLALGAGELAGMR
jgi:uncharacterized membrane protein YfcA